MRLLSSEGSIDVAKKPRQRMEDMNVEHWRIIREMIELRETLENTFKDKGIKNRKGRIAHEFRIDNIPYWIILAG